ncbi:hypothetical protein amrb99_45810 [Actinomadura sp. RB99]|nr:hypothetical protein [Actinomadura sp. RB99]
MGRVRVGVIPQPADCFQEREVAEKVSMAASANGAVVLTQAVPSVRRVLAGMGGVGKTQLAAAYARHAWEQGVEVLVWASAATRDSVVSAYSDAAVRLNLPLADRDDPERCAREFVTWAETTRQSWLVVLDDVQAQGDLRGLWPPVSAAGATVVTTRRRDLAPPGPRSTTIEIGLFTPGEADAYLRTRLGELAADDQERTALINDLDHLPLALAQAAAYMLQQDVDCGRYRTLLAKQFLADTVPAPEDLLDDHQRIVSAVWEISIDRANRSRPAGLARLLIQLASVLDSAGIPAAVLTSQPARDYIASHLPGTDSPTAEAIDQALRLLHRYSLIDYDRAATYREVRIHQLIQRATRENLTTRTSQAHDSATALADAAAAALLAVWPEVERDELGQILRANTDALRQNTGTALWVPDTGAHPVLFRSATSLGETGQVTAALNTYADLHETCLHHFGPDHPDTLAVRGNLASWRGEAGDAASAAATYEELLTDYLRVLGPDHPDTLTTRGNLASWRGEAGDAAGAVTAYEELLTDYLRVLGPDHPDTLTTRGNLARWRGVAGDAAGAAAAYEELLIDCLRVLGSDHPDTLTVRGNLARWRGGAGDAAGAAAAYKELLIDCLRILGPDHPDTLTTRGNLAYWRGGAGDAAGAVTAFEELLTDCLRVLGPDHPDTLTTRNNLARWRGGAGDAAGAVTAFEELLTDRLRILGPDHPGTLTTRGNLARWRGEAGDAAGAVTAFEELLTDRLRILGPDHPDTLTSRNNLAHWRGEAGDTASAAATTEELLTDCLRILGPDHPDTLTTRGNLAYWRGEAGDAAGAAATTEELLTDCLRVLGPDHPDTLTTRNNLASWRGKAGDAASAVTAYEELLTDCLRVLGPDHPDTVIARGNLAHWRGQVGLE